MTTLKVALIGCGRMAREHLDCVAGIPGTRIVALCDRLPEAARRLAARCGAADFSDHRSMLAQARPDVVHVTTPPDAHFEPAADALRGGAHVLVEKPISLVRGEFEVLRKLAQENRRLLVEDHNYRFNRPVRDLVPLLAAGELGEVVHVDVSFAFDLTHPDRPAPGPGLPGGPIADFLTHLAYLSDLFAGRAERVDASWSRLGDDRLPFDELRARLQCGRATAALNFSARTRPEGFRITVEATAGRATISLFEGFLAVERAGGAPPGLLPILNRLRVGRASRRAALRSAARRLVRRPVSYEGVRELVRRFYAAAQNGDPPPVTIDDIAAAHETVLRLLEAIPGETRTQERRP